MERAGSGQYDTSRVVSTGRAGPWPPSSMPRVLTSAAGARSSGSSECGPRYPQQVSSSVSSLGQAAYTTSRSCSVPPGYGRRSTVVLRGWQPEVTILQGTRFVADI